MKPNAFLKAHSKAFLVRGVLGALVFVGGIVTLIVGLVVGEQRLVTTGIILIVGGVPLVLIGGAASAYSREFGSTPRREDEPDA